MNEDGADVVEQGGRRFFPSLNWRPQWRPPRGAAILLAVGLVIGLGAGYALGYRQVPRNASPSPSASPASAAPNPALAPIQVTLTPFQGTGAVFSGGAVSSSGLALIQDTGACSVQTGRELQLGVQVTNESPAVIGLGAIHPVFPLGGLRLIAEQWAPCDATGVTPDPPTLGSGDSIWFSVTVQVLVGCPAPLPVEFTVDYTVQGGHAAAHVPGFPDLSHVPYTGCTGS